SGRAAIDMKLGASTAGGKDMAGTAAAWLIGGDAVTLGTPAVGNGTPLPPSLTGMLHAKRSQRGRDDSQHRPAAMACFQFLCGRPHGRGWHCDLQQLLALRFHEANEGLCRL